jgi:hypothetical protein
MTGFPDPFPGTEEQRQANRRTHRFSTFPDGTCCIFCEVKPWHISADWPCGMPASRYGLGERLDAEMDRLVEGYGEP